MTNRSNSVQLFYACLAIGIVATGCEQYSTESESIPVKDIAAQVDCCGNKECSSDCCGTSTTELAATGESNGCCGKCAEEQAAIAKPVEGCSDCTARADGDSTNCKCAGEKTTKADATEGDQPAETSTTPDDKPLSFAEDREIFHFLLANQEKIQRTVTEMDNGVTTLTESADPAIVAKIQEHVASMYRRVEEIRPIRMRDPLYREVFQHADQIEMKLENTAAGIKVVETSQDEYVVKLIKAHAKVVSGFVEHGFEEARKNHDAPEK